MREKIHTIPVNDAMLSGDECPFCFMERETEQRVLKYVLGPGASYMEPDVRGATDKEGFCGQHLKKMYDYGNSLGSALMMQTYMVGLFEEMQKEMDHFQIPGKRPLFGKKVEVEESSLVQWARKRTCSCFVCNRLDENMDRYMATFFTLTKEEEFRQRAEATKGFCMPHFLQLMEMAPKELPNDQREWFYPTVFRLMQENMARVKGDLDWFIAKFDYRNAGADWKNSKDAVSRSMQKLQGGHVADPIFRDEPR